MSMLLQPGAVVFLRPGEDIEFVPMSLTTANLQAALGDWSNVTFSSVRAGTPPFRSRHAGIVFPKPLPWVVTVDKIVLLGILFAGLAGVLVAAELVARLLAHL